MASFSHLIALAEDAERAPAQSCVDVFLQTVGVELAEKAGWRLRCGANSHHKPLVEELRARTAALLARAQQAGAVRSDLTTADITAAVWALRGVIQSERTDPVHRGQALWRRHLQTVLRGFHDDESGHG